MNAQRLASLLLAALLLPAASLYAGDFPSPLPRNCERGIRADIVAFDQVFFWNRLGAVEPQGMMYALRRDVVPIDSAKGLVPGNVQLREGKRPRPLVLRMNVGDCLSIYFQNLLATSPVDDNQPSTRTASVHVVGMQLVGSIASDGSNVGINPSSLVAPGGSAVYIFYAEREGGYMMHSGAAMTGGEGDGGSINSGLFGAIAVQPREAEWYRSQITEADMQYIRDPAAPTEYPIIKYGAVYPPGHPFDGLPVLAMLQNFEIVHSDLTAIITGPNAGRFKDDTYPPVAVEPDRVQPFREFVTIYHDEIGAVQAFPHFEDPVLGFTLHSVRDGFAINYGTGGIGAEILANRFGVGPMAGCTECKFEDFFLSAWAVADPAMVVDVPANAPCTIHQIEAAQLDCFKIKPKATKAFFPDDPSNVYHSYLRDHLKFRIVHAGSKEHHIHHQHAHQWLHTPDADTSAYLDSQAIGPGSAFTLEMVYNGSGNRNLTVGDSIFHCHFYPGRTSPSRNTRLSRRRDHGRNADPGRRSTTHHRHGAAPRGSGGDRRRTGQVLERRPSRLSVLRSRRGRPPAAAPAARHDRRRRLAAAHHHGRQFHRAAHAPRFPEGAGEGRCVPAAGHRDQGGRARHEIP
jgi:manganese oxidase